MDFHSFRFDSEFFLCSSESARSDEDQTTVEIEEELDADQLHTGSESDEEVVLPIESSCFKRTYDFFRVIDDEIMENPLWLCSDISATISKTKLCKWLAHSLLLFCLFVSFLFGFAFFCSMVVFLALLVYYPMGIVGSVVFWLLFLVVLTIVLVLDAKKEGRCPGHCNFLVKFCNSLHRFCESLESNR